MLLLTGLPAPNKVAIDGFDQTSCARVVIFGGQKIGPQLRGPADKSIVANYLEDGNVVAFATPLANSSDFSGVSTFNVAISSSDILRCL